MAATCRSVNFYGPAIYCEGDYTSIVYTPAPVFNALEPVNNSLVLAPVIWQMLKNGYNWVQSLWHSPDRNPSEELIDSVQLALRDKMQQLLCQCKSLLEDIDKNNNKDVFYIYCLEDLIEELQKNFDSKDCLTKGEIDIYQTRLLDLKIDYGKEADFTEKDLSIIKEQLLQEMEQLKIIARDNTEVKWTAQKINQLYQSLLNLNSVPNITELRNYNSEFRYLEAQLLTRKPMISLACAGQLFRPTESRQQAKPILQDSIGYCKLGVVNKFS